MKSANKIEQRAMSEAEQNAKPDLSAWLKQVLNKGERYAGVIIGADGLPSHHVVLMAGSASDINWSDAKAWAEKAGGELPTRQEQALLFANLKSEFEQRYYWSSEQPAAGSDCAWDQDFLSGYQDDGHKSYEGRARAVRRLPI